MNAPTPPEVLDRSTEMREIPGHEGRFLISRDGVIWSTVTARVIKVHLRRDGYYYAVLRVTGKYIQSAVHRLVAEAWIENPENKPQVNHKNLCKTDNRAENLEWVTRAENMRHAMENLPGDVIARMLAARSQTALQHNHRKRKLTMAQANEVRALVAGGMTHRVAALRFGVCRRSVEQIVKRRNYVA